MGVFGIGPMELFLVLVVALVVFGPNRLPEVAAGVGRAVRDFRRISAELTAEVGKVTEELTEIRQTVTHEVQEVKQAATVTLDLNSPSAPPSAVPAVDPSSSPVAYQPAEASAPTASAEPTAAASFDGQIAELKAEADAVHVNGAASDDVFQDAIQELKRADEQEALPSEPTAPAGEAQPEPAAEPEVVRPATSPALPVRWLSGT